MNKLLSVLALVALALIGAALWWAQSARPVGGAVAGSSVGPSESAATAAEPSAAVEELAWNAALDADSSPARAEAEASQPDDELAAPVDARVIGRVVDADTHPIAGAIVYVARADRGPDAPLDAEAWADRDRRSTQTDSSGRFAFDELRAGPTRLAVRAPGFAPHDRTDLFIVSACETDLGDIELALGVRLSGRVVDALGASVEGAQLLAPFDTGRPSWRGSAGGSGMLLATTSESGAFEIDTLPIGPFILLVHADEHPDQAFEGSSSQPGERIDGIVVRLEAAGAIEGRVVLGRGGVSPSLGELTVVAAYNGSREAQPGEASFSWRGAEPASDGTFRISGLLADEPYRLRARWRRWESDRRGTDIGPTVDAQAGDRGIEIRLGDFLAVTVRVVDASSGAPLEDLDVNLGVERADGREARYDVKTEHLDDGRWRLVSATSSSAGDRVYVRAAGRSHRAGMSASAPVAPGVETDLGTLALEPLARALVRVVDAASGEPIEGARVFAELTSGDDGSALPGVVELSRRGARPVRLRSRSTGADGLAELYATSDALARACVVHDEYPSSELFDLVFTTAALEPLEVGLFAGGGLLVTVLDVDGAPVPGLVVQARWERVDGADSVESLRISVRRERSDLAGQVSLARLTPGSYSVSLIEDRLGGRRDADDRRQTVARVDVLGDETSEVTLVATPHGTLRGRVLEGGRPLAGARIELTSGTQRDLERWRRSSTPEIAATTDASGRYALPRLGAGVWTASIYHATRIVPDVRTFEYDGRDAERDFVLARCSIVGTVRASDGRGVADARVVLGRMRNDRRRENGKSFSPYGGAAANVRSGPDGGYELRGVPPGVELAVAVSHPRFQAERSDGFVLQPDELRTDVDFELALGATIKIEVLTSDGRAPRARVSAVRVANERGKPAKGPERSVSLDGRGRATLDGLPGGRWSVTVRRRFDGQNEPSKEVEVPTGEEAPVRFDVP